MTGRVQLFQRLQPHDALFRISCRTHFMLQELQYNHFLTIISHRNGSGTQVQSDGGRGSFLGQRRAGIIKSQCFPVYQPGKSRKRLGKPATQNSIWHPGAPDPRARKAKKETKAQELEELGQGGDIKSSTLFPERFQPAQPLLCSQDWKRVPNNPLKGSSCTNLSSQNIFVLLHHR